MSSESAFVPTPKHNSHYHQQQPSPQPLKKIKLIQKNSSPLANQLKSRIFAKTPVKGSPQTSDQQRSPIGKTFPYYCPPNQQRKHSEQSQIELKKRNINIRVSPSSHTSSLTSDVPSFELNSGNEIASSTSSTHVAFHMSHFQHPPMVHQSGHSFQQKQPQQSYPSNFSQGHKKQPYTEVPLQNEDPSLDQDSDLESPQQLKNFNRLTTINLASSLANWKMLPVEIFKVIQASRATIEDIQMNFDDMIPTIEMPGDRRLAQQKIVEAQRQQESLVLDVLNIPEGTSLQSAIGNIINEFNRSPSQVDRSGRTFNSQFSSPRQHIRSTPTKFKKITKKISSAPAIHKTQSVQAFHISSAGKHSSLRHNGIHATASEKFGGNQQRLVDNTSNYLNETGGQEKDVDNRTYLPHGVLDFGEGIQGNNSHGIEIGFAVQKNNILSPRKNILQPQQGFEEEVGSQHEIHMNQLDDYSYQQFKLKRHMSDPYGDYYFNSQNYNNSHPHPFNHAPNNFFNQADNPERSMQMEQQQYIEEDNPFEDHHIRSAYNFKKDEDDTLYGAFQQQNDSFEDLLNSQNKKNKQQRQQLNNSNNNNQQSQQYQSSLTHFEDLGFKPNFKSVSLTQESFLLGLGAEEAVISKQGSSAHVRNELGNNQPQYNGSLSSSFNRAG